MNPKYRFFLKKDNAERVPAYPVYGNDLSIEWERESGEMYYRRKLAGKLTFVGPDYDLIMPTDNAFGNTFIVDIEISYDNGTTWSAYWQGVFYHTDCEIDLDNKTVVVTPSVNDEYIDVIAGLEKEYNMIDLQPPIFEVKVKKRPIIQLARTTFQKVGCFKADGVYWETDMAQTSIGLMARDYHFFFNNALVEMTMQPIAGTGTVLSNIPVHLKQMFIGHQSFEQDRTMLWMTYNDGSFIYAYYQYNNLFQIFSLSKNKVIYSGVVFIEAGVDAVVHCVEGENYADLNVRIEGPEIIMGRLILDEADEETYPIPDNDIVTDNYNYRYCKPFNGQQTIYYTDTYSATPTKWGLHATNEYYKTPPTGYYEVTRWLPIAMSAWEDNAIWFGWSPQYIPIDSNASTNVWLRHAYYLRDVMNGLLTKVAPNIEVDWLSFLGGTDPITGIERYFFITPKSNMKKINYDNPAMEAPITLKSILDMLRECYNCYWHIQNGVMYINHISYYENGGSYDAHNLQIGTDLTETYNLRNGKNWAFGQGKISFEKPDMTARYEYSWMDKQTIPFDGEPLNILASYVNKDKVEKISVNHFSSDVDYILMNPDDISDDGFVLMLAVVQDGVFTLPFMTIPEMDDINLQNPYCAFIYLEEKYLSYGLPAPSYRIGEGQIKGAHSTARIKTQEASVPCLYDPDINKLIKTSVGEGQIEKLSINLSSRNGKATLKFQAQ